MPDVSAGDSIGDAEWDRKYFSLILELEEKYASRYEMQASKLLVDKSMEILIKSISITYKLDRLGCSYSIHDERNSNLQKGWSRIGWGKSAKRKALPYLFAKSEADVLIDLNQ
jgi:hypothetical protein